jgi:hypothetical protein
VTLARLVSSASGFAAAGQVADGYDTLRRGLRHAQELAEDGDPYGSALVREWEREISSYCRRFGVKLTEPQN